MNPSRRATTITTRIILLVLLGLLLDGPVIAGDAGAAPFEPYTVYVSQEESHARCGPSSDEYRTDALRHGQALQVYAEAEGGWLGIRPPETSFCWIPAETVELDLDGEAGSIVEDQTVAWIGTQLGRARSYRWQVRLALGEPVTVIGKSEREGPDGPQVWYRIVPPSGEFRWVHRDQVVNTSEELVASTTEQSVLESNLSTDQPTAVNEPIGSGVDEKVAETMKRKGLLASVAFLGQPRLQQIDAPESTPASAADTEPGDEGNWIAGVSRGFLGSGVVGSPPDKGPSKAGALPGMSDTSVRQVSGALPMPAQNLIPMHSNPSSLSPAATPVELKPMNVISSDRIDRVRTETIGADIQRLTLILSRLMASQASGLETEPVAMAARQLADSTSDSSVASRARLLAERADQYRRVANRRDGSSIVRTTGELAFSPSPIGSATSTLPTDSSLITFPDSLAVDIAPETSTVAADPPVYRGQLVQVYSARPNSPPFALTDNTGRTVAYVTPMPGVNLRTHLNSHVNVIGSTGYLTGLEMPHVMATQAVRSAP